MKLFKNCVKVAWLIDNISRSLVAKVEDNISIENKLEYDHSMFAVQFFIPFLKTISFFGKKK